MCVFTAVALLVFVGPAALAALPQLPETPRPAAVPSPDDGVPALLAALRGSDRERGFAALCKLAVGGYRADVAEQLLAIAVDPAAEETWRDYAAMGLGNMHAMPEAERLQVRAALRAALATERGDTPDGIIGQLAARGDAAFVRDTLGAELHGNRHEIEVLEQVPDAASRERLLAILAASPGRKAEPYGRRFAVGKALLRHGDRRGVEVLMQLLPRDSAPGYQHRRNVYAVAAPALAAGFGVLATGTEAELDAAIESLLQWWQAHGEGFRLAAPVGGPAAAPAPAIAEVAAQWQARLLARSHGEARAVVRRLDWIDAPVLRRLFPGWSFGAVAWGFEPAAGAIGSWPALMRTTLAIRGGQVVHELPDSGDCAAFGALLHSAGVKVAAADDARVVWEAFWALHAHRWPLRQVERTAAGGWALRLGSIGATSYQYEIEVDESGVVRAGRLHAETAR